MINFSKRHKLDSKYKKWFEDNYRIDEHSVLLDDTITLINYLVMNKLLDENRVNEFLKEK